MMFKGESKCARVFDVSGVQAALAGCCHGCCVCVILRCCAAVHFFLCITHNIS